jgi:hypothetical protein
MADGNYGQRDIQLDLTVAGARVIRDATKGERAKIRAITVSGTSGAASGSLILRGESASGPIVWQLTDPTAATTYNFTANLDGVLPIKGLYMDAPGTVWAAGAVCIIHTD